MEYYKIGSCLRSQNLHQDLIKIIYDYCGDEDAFLSVRNQNRKDNYCYIRIDLENNYSSIYYCYLCDKLFMEDEFEAHFQKFSHIAKLPGYENILKYCSESERISILEDIVLNNMNLNMKSVIPLVIKIRPYCLT